MTDPGGKRYLAGRTVGNWPPKAGTLVVLRRVGDEYELSELGERPCRFTPELAEAWCPIREALEGPPPLTQQSLLPHEE